MKKKIKHLHKQGFVIINLSGLKWETVLSQMIHKTHILNEKDVNTKEKQIFFGLKCIIATD